MTGRLVGLTLLSVAIAVFLGACAYQQALDHQRRIEPVIVRAESGLRVGQSPDELRQAGFALHNCTGPIKKPIRCEAGFDKLGSNEVPRLSGVPTSADNKTEGRALNYEFFFINGRLSSYKKIESRTQ